MTFARILLLGGAFLVMASGSVAQDTATTPEPENNPGASAPAAKAPSEGLLWKIQDEDSTVFLAGSIHYLREEDLPLPQDYLDAFEEAELVVFEIVPSEMMQGEEATKLLSLLMVKGLLLDGTSLRDHIKPDTYKAVQELITDSPLGSGGMLVIDRLQPWAVGFFIQSLTMESSGFNPLLGVDFLLDSDAKEAGKPRESLETMEYQLGLLADAADGKEDEFIMQAIEDSEATMGAIEGIVDAWKAGDEKTVDELMHASMKDFPEFTEKLLYTRNANWIPQIREYLARSDDVLVVVGAGHLVGKKSVIDLLEKEGLQVQQL